MRILGVADTDSYVKWGAATLARTPADWDRSLVVLETPLLPTEDQRLAAVDGFGIDAPDVLSLDALAQRVADYRPDVVFLSLRGPVIRVVLRAVLDVSPHRPVFLSGLPGISIPATKKGMSFRSQCDLLILHSKREIRDFSELTERIGIPHRFGLATLPFLLSKDAHVQLAPRRDRNTVIFAVQAKVPRVRSDRMAIVEWLAECARRHPDLRVVMKLRAVGAEKQTHTEFHPYDELLEELADRPSNLVAESGSMAAHLANAVGLVTVSSTALIEAIASGVPGLALDDFGVSKRLINPVFENSNLFGSAGELIAAHFRSPEPEWLDDNYFHAPGANDWIVQLEELVAANQAAPLPLKRQHYGRAGGTLRHVWDRKQALGALDRSTAGYVALAIGYPTRAVLRAARRTRGMVRRAFRAPVDESPTESLETSPQSQSLNSSSIDLTRAP